MKNLAAYRLKGIKNSIAESSGKKYLFVFLFGISMLLLLGFVSFKVFGYIYSQKDFTPQLRLFLTGQLLTMFFLTMFMMLILSSMISTLNIFFLSRDLKLLFTSPLSQIKIFVWKSFEVSFNSSLMVLFFTIPVLFGYLYYFSPSLPKIAAALSVLLLFLIIGVLCGIIIGFIIPLFISVRRLQPVLSVISILLISAAVILFRMLQPEKFGNPQILDNVMEFIKGFSTPVFNFFPFRWLSESLKALASSEFKYFIKNFMLLLGSLSFLSIFLILFGKKFYFNIFDKVSRGSRISTDSGLSKNVIRNDMRMLYKKEVITFIRTPEQWSQLLVIAAITVVFIINMKAIPAPSPAVKNIIAYLNIGMAAFIVAGLNSRFTFTSIPMENPGIVHIMASPFNRTKVLKLKFLFNLIPMMILSLALFFTGEVTLGLDSTTRISGILYLFPVVTFLTVLAIWFGLRVRSSRFTTPQHLIISSNGIALMLWSLAYVVITVLYMIRPLFIYYFSKLTRRPVPIYEIFLWILLFYLINISLIILFLKKSEKLWSEKEFQ